MCVENKHLQEKINKKLINLGITDAQHQKQIIDHLNTLADIIIESFLEERVKANKQ